MFAEMKPSSGVSVTIEHIGNIASGSSSNSKTVNFKTGTYARDDYASLSADNFLVIPHRSSSGASTSYSSSVKAIVKGAATSYSHKKFTYSDSTGVLTFYGGLYAYADNRNGATQLSSSGTASYDVYIIKPGLSSVVA